MSQACLRPAESRAEARTVAGTSTAKHKRQRRSQRRALRAHNLGFASGTIFGAFVMFVLINIIAEVWL